MDKSVNVKGLIDLLNERGIKYEITNDFCFYTIHFGKYEVMYEPGDIFINAYMNDEEIDYDFGDFGQTHIPTTLFKDVF